MVASIDARRIGFLNRLPDPESHLIMITPKLRWAMSLSVCAEMLKFPHLACFFNPVISTHAPSKHSTESNATFVGKKRAYWEAGEKLNFFLQGKGKKEAFSDGEGIGWRGWKLPHLGLDTTTITFDVFRYRRVLRDIAKIIHRRQSLDRAVSLQSQSCLLLHFHPISLVFLPAPILMVRLS